MIKISMVFKGKGMGRVPRRYAQALFDLARKQGIVKPLLSQMASFISILHNHPDLNLLFSDQFVTRQQAEGVMSELAKRLNLHPLLAQFFLLLATKRRLNLFKEIFQALKHLDERHQHILRGQVVSAFPLTPDQLAALTEVLSRKFKETIILEPSLDASLLGGMVLTLGSYCLDTSFKTKLKAFQTFAKG